ncbi:hypothetical protein TC41_1111 [Alicyclobacillus acidocaldarius subsp. acidocaldarius Tc-4-1]|uniref:Integrase catalytic domain-containing protein n=2 Tax=Alicyclobacillus acidocaldarius TaxID=405212 RepID=F8IGG3_ALIAT|nr:hypothetical protein TC41_1111 [Alicyclobacillus acidocaldarius subsp. acidocaldarius Tc-4-1]
MWVSVYAYRKIVGWRADARMTKELCLDALDQAYRRGRRRQGCVTLHHSDRGSQYVKIPVENEHKPKKRARNVGSKLGVKSFFCTPKSLALQGLRNLQNALLPRTKQTVP